ncbi:hypothetical protein BDF19DRAFT_414210 [Syncephalis fuscata]|nr:hypothetical protein BDF19DRAFT_414210 [Syncephalis fuscata]
MFKHNNNTLPKIWLVVEIVYYISQFSGIDATVALARTCKVLYNSIIKYDGFWQTLYQQHFPRNINTDIDWLQWQLTQELSAKGAVTDIQNETVPKLTWFRRYGQRVNMSINWQNNKPTSTIYPSFFMIDKLLKSSIRRSTIITSYPGWIAMADRDNLFVDLIKLSTTNTVKVHSLDLDKDRFNKIKNIIFYQHRQQVDATDEGMRLIIRLSYSKRPFDILQIWDANSYQLLHSIDVDGNWDGRIIDASLVFPSSQIIGPSIDPKPPCNSQLVYNIFSTAQSCRPRSIILSNFNNSYSNRIHIKNDKETIIIRYYNSEHRFNYEIVRVLSSNTDLQIIDNDTARMTTIASDYITFSNITMHWTSEIYSIDSDRILVHCSAYQLEETPNGLIDSNQGYIRVVSLSKGTIFDDSHSVDTMHCLILFPAYNLVVLDLCINSSLVVMSLFNGKILHEINTIDFRDEVYYFQHLIDAKIVGYSHNTNQYFVIDVVTGNVDIHRFPISMVRLCKFVFGHMLLMNKETILITSFISELI